MRASLRRRSEVAGDACAWERRESVHRPTLRDHASAARSGNVDNRVLGALLVSAPLAMSLPRTGIAPGYVRGACIRCSIRKRRKPCGYILWPLCLWVGTMLVRRLQRALSPNWERGHNTSAWHLVHGTRKLCQVGCAHVELSECRVHVDKVDVRAPGVLSRVLRDMPDGLEVLEHDIHQHVARRLVRAHETNRLGDLSQRNAQ
mmetsp:Transcript_5768/g.14774  ORF Transcript_5768/g.14774 Transcript_5768/m.14774 type:complete len:203 (-) Transcript_5768:42-650(-)